jgi:4-hydroxybenzoate polyprenyltransferase
MMALQFGIGATNDLVDAPRDAGHKPGKPIPAGLVDRRSALVVAISAFAMGLVLSILSGPAMVALAAVVIGIGLAYDLRLKGTPWSWLPFAVGIPILPVFGWLGAAGALPPAFAFLVPVALAAGAALAVANALADVERDRAAGVASIATALGPGRAWAIGAALVVAILAVALGSAAALRASPTGLVLVAAASWLPLAGLLLGRGRGADVRERGWQLEAVGMAAVGVAWIWVIRG